MWSNAPFVLLSVRFGKRFRLRLPMALYTLSGLLLALEGALSLVPGRSGREWRALSDGVYGFLRELQAQPPQELSLIHIWIQE